MTGVTTTKRTSDDMTTIQSQTHDMFDTSAAHEAGRLPTAVVWCVAVVPCDVSA